MSPYRVLVKDEDGSLHVYVSTIKTSKYTGLAEIRIVQKIWPLGYTNPEEVAHSTISSRNSIVVDTYTVTNIFDTLYKTTYYRLSHKLDSTISNCSTTIDDSNILPTLHNCLVAAMKDFAANSNLTILTEL